MKFMVNLQKEYYNDFRDAYLEWKKTANENSFDPADELSEYMYDYDCSEGGEVFQDVIRDIAKEIIKKVDKENKK